VNGLLTLMWLSAPVDCAEASSLVTDTGDSWAVLPPRPSSETCQGVFVVWSPGTLNASAFAPSVMTGALTASEPSTCGGPPASILNAPISETVSAVCGLPLLTSTGPLSVGAPAMNP